MVATLSPELPYLYRQIAADIFAGVQAKQYADQQGWRETAEPPEYPTNAQSLTRYGGGHDNSLSETRGKALFTVANEKNYPLAYWASADQWAKLGAQIRIGEAGVELPTIKLVKIFEGRGCYMPEYKIEEGFTETLFNCAQTDGWLPSCVSIDLGPIKRIESVDRFVSATGAKIIHEGEEQFYDPNTDIIHMPDEGRYVGTETMSRTQSYYWELFQFLALWTSPAHRMNWQDENWIKTAMNETEWLVAELVSAFLMRDLGVTDKVHKEHASNALYCLRHSELVMDALRSTADKAVKIVRYFNRFQCKL